MQFKPVVFFVLGVLALACTSAPPPPAVDLVLVGGHVIDVVSGETLLDRDVWILDQEIAAIAPTGSREIPADTETISWC